MLLEEDKIETALRTLANIVRIGVVVATYPDRGTVRAQFQDQDSYISHELYVLCKKTHKDKEYWMPDVGEQVVCVFLPNSLETGFVVGAIYSDQDKVPVSSMDKKRFVFEDGTVLEYDRKSHLLYGDIKGDVDISVTGKADIKAGSDVFINSATKITIQAPNISIKGGSPANGVLEGDFTIIGSLQVEGGVEVNGNIHATGTIIDDGGNTNHHTH